MDAEERETMRMLGQLKRENDALKAENAKLLVLLKGFRCGECGNVAARASNISLASENAKLREALQEALYRCQEDEAITVPVSFTMLLKKALKSGEDTKE